LKYYYFTSKDFVETGDGFYGKMIGRLLFSAVNTIFGDLFLTLIFSLEMTFNALILVWIGLWTFHR